MEDYNILEALEDLSGMWKHFQPNTQRFLSLIIAGKQNAGSIIFNDIMEDYYADNNPMKSVKTTNIPTKR